MVPGGGVEPPWPEGRRILSPLRLPVPPSRLRKVFVQRSRSDRRKPLHLGDHLAGSALAPGGQSSIAQLLQASNCRTRSSLDLVEYDSTAQDACVSIHRNVFDDSSVVRQVVERCLLEGRIRLLFRLGTPKAPVQRLPGTLADLRLEREACRLLHFAAADFSRMEPEVQPAHPV